MVVVLVEITPKVGYTNMVNTYTSNLVSSSNNNHNIIEIFICNLFSLAFKKLENYIIKFASFTH